MKNHFFRILFLICLNVFLFSSCSSSGDSVDTNGITTGNYFPLAVNNKWIYTDGTSISQVNIIGLTNSGGFNYYEYKDTSSLYNNQNWMVKKGASYYQKSGVLSYVQSGYNITIQDYELKVLRDDLNVGASWSGSASPKVTYYGSGGSGSFNLNINYTGTVSAKNATETVSGQTYSNIIKVTIAATSNSNGQISTTNAEYWFAKDVGLIYSSETSSANNTTTIKSLTSYTLN